MGILVVKETIDSQVKDRDLLYQTYLKALCVHFNRVHGESHDCVYWESLVGPWLWHLICYLQYRYVLVDNGYVLREDYTHLAQETGYAPYDYVSFLYLFERTDYVAELDNLLWGKAKDIRDKKWVCRQFLPITLSMWKRVLFKLLSRVSRLWMKAAPVLMVSPWLSWKQLCRVVWISRGRIRPVFLMDSDSSGEINDDFRCWSSTSFMQCLPKNLQFTWLLNQVPWVYLEGYQALKKRVPIMPEKCQLLFSAVGWNQDEVFKLMAADAAENGVLRVGMQHGGGPYGSGCGLNVLQEMKSVDHFLTWGWSDRDLSCSPVGSARLQQLVQRVKYSPQPEKGGVLYLGTTVSKSYPSGFGSPSGYEFKAYLAWQHLFLTSLSTQAASQLTVRLYPDNGHYGWNQAEGVRALKPDLLIDSTTPYAKALSNAQLVVCDNHYSTWMEVCACDIPGVWFFDPHLWPIHPRAYKIFEDMKRVGIWHDSPISAAKQIDRIIDDPYAWWHSTDVRPVIQRFSETFAYVPMDFPRQLTQKLLRLAQLE